MVATRADSPGSTISRGSVSFWEIGRASCRERDEISDVSSSDLLDPPQPVAELFDHRLGNGRDTGGQPRLDDQPWFRLVLGGGFNRLSRLACGHFGNKKERVPGDPLSKPVRL